jgi:hypothetical protein
MVGCLSCRSGGGRAGTSAFVLALVVVVACSGSDPASSPASSTASTAPPAPTSTTARPPSSAPGTTDPADTVARDVFGDPADVPSILPAEKVAIIDALPADAVCEPAAPQASPTPGRTEEVLLVVRAIDGCLVSETSIVPARELDARASEAMAQPDVVAADAATHGQPLSVALQPEPDQAKKEWWQRDLSLVGTPDGRPGLDGFVPNNALPRLRVAVLDMGVDDHPELADIVSSDGFNEHAVDDEQHGTHVAGIIGARRDGDAERGIADHVELLDVTEGATYFDMIIWAIAHRARVINISLMEGDRNGPIREPNLDTFSAMRLAQSRGILVFAAAGNCGVGSPPNSVSWVGQCQREADRVMYPAAYPGVIGVGNYNEPGRVAATSTRNGTVDISAPGDEIWSTVGSSPGGGMKSGTSQAAPMVAGVAAALLAHRPDLTSTTVLTALMQTARPAGPPGRDTGYGMGRVDPVAAAQLLDETSPAAAPDLVQLASARVPPMCDHPAGTLVDGSLPGIPAGEGGVDVGAPLAVGDVTGDGVPEAAVVATCTHGGVSWPSQVVIYTAGPTLVGAVDLGSLTRRAQRATVESLTFADGHFVVSWLTNQEGDLDCCPTREVTATITVVDGKPLPSEVVDQDRPPSAGSGACSTTSFREDTGLSTENAICADGWAIGVPTDCGDQCEHVEVFQTEASRWIHVGSYPSVCAAELQQSGMPAATAQKLIPISCDEIGGVAPSVSTLRRGDTGEAVTKLQEALARRGYSLDVDGEFGPGTEAAVRAFQAVSGLEVDGVAGPATQAALGL